MRQHILRFFGLVAFLGATSALATHALAPINLKQEVSGTPLAPGTIVFPGTPIRITATSPASTNGTGTYDLQLEIVSTSQAFTGVPTHSGGTILNKAPSDQEWSGLITSTLPPGSYKWQARQQTTGSPSLSAWVPFSGGSLAFIIAPPNVADLLVEQVTLTSVNSDQASDLLEFVVNGDFKNRGTVDTGNFTWNAYLSTDKVLQVGSDTLIFSSTTPISVPGESTVSDASTLVSLSPRPPPGTYYVLIEADPAPQGCTTNCGTVSEFDELNNVGSMANYFVNGVDLVATSISNGPLNAGPGGTFNLTVDFYNQGVDSVANPVEFRIVATRDPNVSLDDFEVYRSAVTVGGAQVFSLSVPITLPAGVAGGDVRWGLELDPAGPNGIPPNPVPEALETNNTALSAAATHVQQADLSTDFGDMVDVLTGQPVRVGDVGQQARFQIRATNLGDFAAPQFQVGVILSKDNNLSLLVDHIFADVQVQGLLPGTSNTTVYDVVATLPSVDKAGNPLVTGDYYFFLLLDSYNETNELNEANNTIAVLGPVRLRTPAADYSVLRVETPAGAAAGEAFPLSRIIKNVGTDAGPQAEYACYASANADIRPTDFPLSFVNANGTSSPRRIIQLNAGEADSATEWVRAPGTVPTGPYFVGCLVDPDNAVFELDETNNAFSPAAPTQVTAQTLRIVTAQVPDAIVDVPYQFRLSAAGASGPLSWSIVGAAPENMVLGELDGTLLGTPTSTGIYTLRVEADDGQAVAERTLTLRILPPSTELTITTDALPPLFNNTQLPYQAALSASGGSRPYAWSIVEGTLPGGLTLDPATGELSGMPQTGIPNGPRTLTVEVRSSLGSVARKQVTLRTVAPGALTIVSLGMPEGMVGEEYLTDLKAEVAGMPTNAKPLTWSIVAGTFPEGLVLDTHTDQETGLVTGAPTKAGTYAFTLQVVDADGRVDARDLVVPIHPNAVKVTLQAPPPATLHRGDAVDLTVLASSEGATFRLFSGALPPGVELDEEGKISGTIEPEAAFRTWTFVVEARDARGAKGLGAFSLEVTPVVVEEGCSSSGGGLSLFASLVAMAGLLLAARRRAAVRVRAKA